MALDLVDGRDLLAFPSGDNSSDTIIAGAHFNVTTLNHWNYTYYSNGTISNGSHCCLVFEPYTPHLLQNGTFLNDTSCYSPIKSIGHRSEASLSFACFFFLSLMFTFINLRKHGRLFLPLEKRFRAIGRRWQWYWMIVVAAFAAISGITSVDVDRYYLPELPIVLTNFFWFLMLPSTMAVVWESVRHWGSWQERQLVDPNPFAMRQDDRRSKVEFYLPLVFYVLVWLNIFMVVPRSWTAIERQRDPEQARLHAQPVATDARFKAAAFFLFIAWLTTTISLHHSIKHYKSQTCGMLNRAFGFIKYTPIKFLLTLPLSLVMIAYEAAIAFDFTISPLNVDPNLPIVYLLGWLPVALIFVVYEIAGYMDPNEDRELIRQRRIRDTEADNEMGVARKPRWWSRLHDNNQPVKVHDAIARNVDEIGGGKATSRNVENNIELGNMPTSKPTEQVATYAMTSQTRPEGPETVRLASSMLFPSQPGTSNQDPNRFFDTPISGRGRNDDRSTADQTNGIPGAYSDRSNSTHSGTTPGANPQQIRSMLDV